MKILNFYSANIHIIRDIVKTIGRWLLAFGRFLLFLPQFIQEDYFFIRGFILF